MKHSKETLRHVMRVAAAQRKRGVPSALALKRAWATHSRSPKRYHSKPKKKGTQRMAMPPALARWHRQHRGHKKGHHRKHRKGTSMVRYARPTVIRVNTGAVKRKHHRRRHHGGGGSKRSIGQMLTAAAYGALWGYATDVKKLDILDKVPKLGGLPKEMIIGAALELTGLTRKGLGPIKAQWLDGIAMSGIIIGGNTIGKANFKLSGDDD